MSTLAVVSIGLVLGVGEVLFIQGLRGRRILPSFRPTTPGLRSDRLLAWGAATLVAGLVTFAITGWFVAACGVAALVASAPARFHSGRQRADHVARTEAIATWAEMVRDNMAGAAGLEQALISSAAHAPSAIAPEVRRFAARLDREPLIESLIELGNELDHPSADLVVVSLVNAARMEARDLGALLGRLSESIRADVRMRLRVEVGRTRIRMSARIVVATTVLTILFMFVFSQNLLAAYDSTQGQLWLLVVAAVFAAGGAMLRSYGHIEMPERFRSRRATEQVRGS